MTRYIAALHCVLLISRVPTDVGVAELVDAPDLKSEINVNSMKLVHMGKRRGPHDLQPYRIDSLGDYGVDLSPKPSLFLIV